MRNSKHIRKLQFILLIVIMVSCNPLDLPEAEQEFDIRGEVIAFVTPDTVQVGVPFRVQVSYPNICGGYFSKMSIYESLSNEQAVMKITVSPIVHVIPQKVCPTIYSVNTVETKLQLNTTGRYELVADGRFGRLQKFVQVVTNHPIRQNYRIRFKFVNEDRLPAANHGASFWLTDSGWIKRVIVYSNSSGIMDTSFTHSSSELEYNLDEIGFKAQRGITEDGVIILPWKAL